MVIKLIMAGGIARGRVRTHDDDDNGGDGVAQHGGHTPKEVDRDIKPWFTVYFFDIGHSCYDQLTPLKTGYPLTSITWPYRGLKFTAHRSQIFKKLTADQLLVFDWIAGSCQINLLKTGQDCSKVGFKFKI